MSRPLRVGSLFAGIGGFDLGFERAGFDVAWCVEWDRNAQSVLRRRFPNASIYGDITQVNPDELAPVDVVCGGFPCQDLSVAGKRAGLAGNRSGLFHDAMRIVRRIKPSILVLENVPGLLSSNNGLDFATVLREVGEGWDCAEVAWRVLDSRYFRVPQRRRRVFVVAGARAGCAEQILALSESVSWHPTPRGKARKDAAADARGCFAAGGTWWDGGDLAASVTTRSNEQFMPDKGNFAAVIDRAAFNQGINAAYDPRIEESDEMSTLVSRGPHAVAFRKSKRAQTAEDDETWVDDGISNTLNGFDTGDSRTTHAIALHGGQTHALTRAASKGATEDGTGRGTPIVAQSMSVRRLTPTECERLQGFPDGWTEGQADTHRYKQLGNAVTVNVAEWIARRAHKHLQEELQ